jgi:uncharacterized protein YqeY
MKPKIDIDFKNAMKNKDKLTLSVIRMLKGAIQLEEINKRRELDENELFQVLSKQIKTRNEMIVEFEKANRPELKEQALAEIKILNEYMPILMTEEEIVDFVQKSFLELKPSKNEIGKIMGHVTKELKGKADMSIVNRIVKNELEKI